MPSIPGNYPAEGQPWKVMVSIPNMGYTDPLAYDNRLVWAYRMGLREERARWLRRLPPETIEALLPEISPRPAEVNWAEHATPYEFYFATVGKVLTPFAREMLADKALDHGMDLVVMIDDDMVGDPDSFFRLAHNVTNGPADICGALAFTRGAPHLPVCYTSISGFDAIDRGEFFQNHPVERYPKDKLFEVDAVGFGMAVFTTEMLRRVPVPRFMSTCGSGEDIYFCYKAKKLGARVFCDTRVKLGHIGTPPIITEDTYETQEHFLGRRTRDGDETKYAEVEQPAWATLQ